MPVRERERGEPGRIYRRAKYVRDEHDRGLMFLALRPSVRPVFRGVSSCSSSLAAVHSFVRLSCRFLWQTYRPNVYYYEVWECIRKLFLTGLLVYFKEGTSSQVRVCAGLTSLAAGARR